MNWCEVPLFSKSTIFEQYNKRSGKGLFEVNDFCLNIPSIRIKEEDEINSRPIKIGNLGENSQL